MMTLESERDVLNMSQMYRQYPDDLHPSPSGHGYEYEPIHTSFCPDGVPLEFALLSLLAAFGVAFGVLYVALTMAQGGRQHSDDMSLSDNFLLWESNIADLVWAGNLQTWT